MLSEAKIEAYRHMTVEERWWEVEQLMAFAWQSLKELPEEEMQRRLSFVREEHDKSDAIMLDHLRKFQ